MNKAETPPKPDEQPLLFELGQTTPIVTPELPPEPKIVEVDLTTPMPFTPLTGARFSPCRTWRYNLWRRFKEKGPTLFAIGVNPSKAAEEVNDPTVSRLESFAKRDGFALLVLGNEFAFVATKPGDMKKATDPIGPENDEWLVKMRKSADLCIVAWGNNGRFRKRDEAVIKLLAPFGPLHCFGRNGKSKNGSPSHPLYLRADTKIIPFVNSLEEVEL